MSEILRTEKLTRDFGSLRAVNEVDFSVQKGEIRSVIGPNGAGKSTFLDLIINKIRPTSGKVFFNGEEITGLSPHLIVRKGLGRCFQISKFFPELTVFENVQIPCMNTEGIAFDILHAGQNVCHDKVEHLLEAVGIQKYCNETAGRISYGDQRRLEIAIALATNPIALLMDEPTSGVARREGYLLMDLAVRLAQDMGMTIIFIEHDMDIVFNYSQKISVLHHGGLIATGSPEEIRQNEVVQTSYLGGAV